MRQPGYVDSARRGQPRTLQVAWPVPAWCVVGYIAGPEKWESRNGRLTRLPAAVNLQALCVIENFCSRAAISQGDLMLAKRLNSLV